VIRNTNSATMTSTNVKPLSSAWRRNGRRDVSGRAPAMRGLSAQGARRLRTMGTAGALFRFSVPTGRPRPGPARAKATAMATTMGSVLRFLTAGESHGKGLVVIVEGLPAGLPVRAEDIGEELARRRLGYGRGPGCASRPTS